MNILEYLEIIKARLTNIQLNIIYLIECICCAKFCDRGLVFENNAHRNNAERVGNNDSVYIIFNVLACVIH